METKTFYDTPNSELTFIPFDIETTGLFATDTVTSIVMFHKGTYNLWLNTGQRDVSHPDLFAELDESIEDDFSLHLHGSDKSLLVAVRKYIEMGVDGSKSIFVAYNGEIWKGGFDLKFLRTRAHKLGVTFPFAGHSYMDIMEVYNGKDRFNTTVPSAKGLNKAPLKKFADHIGADYESGANKSVIQKSVEEHGYAPEELDEWCAQNGTDVPGHNFKDLVGVHNVLFPDKKAVDVDPWADSAEAVTCFKEGRFVELILHNFADVAKTLDLTLLATDPYMGVHKKEYQPVQL